MKGFVKALLVMFLVAGFACSSNRTKENSDNEKTELTATTDAGLVTLTVEGMTCTGCENTLKSKLITIEGVQSVEASHETGTVVVKMSKEELNSEDAPQLKLAKAVEESGYTVASIVTEKTN